MTDITDILIIQPRVLGPKSVCRGDILPARAETEVYIVGKINRADKSRELNSVNCLLSSC